MLFFCVFLRESARTAAKSRTNLSTNSGKATKQLGRLAPNLAHMCKFIWEWIYAKQIPLDTQEGTWRVLGGQQFKSLGKLSDWHQMFGEAVKRLDRLAPHLLINLRSPRDYVGPPFLRSSVRSFVRACCSVLDSLVQICKFIWEWT